MIAAIIQARMGSSRLPGKMLSDIEGHPLLWHVIERTKAAKKVDVVIVATSRASEDKKIAGIAEECFVKVYIGSEDDVLDRYYQAAKENNIDVIVRVTADDPFKDPEIIDKAIEIFLEKNLNGAKLDYVSNTIEPTFPEGLDIEVFSFSALEKAWKEAIERPDREHVTPYIWKNKKKFFVENFKNKDDLSELRWTIDYQKDLDFAREVYKNLYRENDIFLMEDILRLLKDNPDLSKINLGIIRNEGYLKSIKHGK